MVTFYKLFHKKLALFKDEKEVYTNVFKKQWTSNSSQPERDFALIFPPMDVQNASYHWVIISGLFDVVRFLTSALSLLHPSLGLSHRWRLAEEKVFDGSKTGF